MNNKIIFLVFGSFHRWIIVYIDCVKFSVNQRKSKEKEQTDCTVDTHHHNNLPINQTNVFIRTNLYKNTIDYMFDRVTVKSRTFWAKSLF